jgi:hypothetical protein
VRRGRHRREVAERQELPAIGGHQEGGQRVYAGLQRDRGRIATEVEPAHLVLGGAGGNLFPYKGPGIAEGVRLGGEREVKRLLEAIHRPQPSLPQPRETRRISDVGAGAPGGLGPEPHN